MTNATLWEYASAWAGGIEFYSSQGDDFAGRAKAWFSGNLQNRRSKTDSLRLNYKRVSMQSILNFMGTYGWELTGISNPTSPSSVTTFWFKRPYGTAHFGTGA